MGERMKKFTKYFGGQYMKYWYIAFAITVLLMLAFSISDSKVDKFKFTIYNEDGSIQSDQIISKEEVELRARSVNSRSVEPEKLF